jgi:hypothetical protein
MGNSSSSNLNASLSSEHMLARDEDMDFEPVQVVSQPTSPQQQQDKSNDLSQSGVLVEALPTGVAVMMTDQEKEEISKRRIVKGTPPTPTTRSTSSTGLSSQAAAEAAAAKAKAAKDDIANAELLEEHHSHVATVISSVNDDELLLESLELDKQQRLKTLSREQKTKREKAIEERRKHPAGGVAGASSSTSKDSSSSSTTTGTSTTTTPENSKPKAKPNPFSRFLSAFSVESQFPKHKRAYTKDENDDTSEDFQLEAKRLKRNDRDDDEEEEEGSPPASFWQDQWPWIAAATAVAALAVLVAQRLKKR